MMNQSRMPEEKEGFIETLNHQGFMTSSLDIYSKEFVSFAGRAQKPVLDIGAAFGVASLEALKAGASVIANDIDARHLEILKERTPEEYKDKLRLVMGAFPDELNFEAGSLSAVLACRVMHFFDGSTIEASANKIYSWLSTGGKVFIVGETVYVRTMQNFIREFEDRIAKGENWPGYFDDVHERCAPEVKNKLPETKHFFSPEMLWRVFQNAGFKIEKCDVFPRPDFPKWLQLDGRESCGLIAVKL